MTLLARLLLSLSALSSVLALPCPQDQDGDKLMQITKVKCECCDTLESFLAKNEYVFLLFYAPTGKSVNHKIAHYYKQFYEEYRYTKVAFGLVDVNIDQEYSEMYLKEGEIPTNIMWYQGQPITVKVADFQTAIGKYHGEPAGQKFLVDKYLDKAKKKESIHYSKELQTVKKWNKYLDKAYGENGDSGKTQVIGYFPALADPKGRLMNIFRHAVYNVVTGRTRYDTNTIQFATSTDRKVLAEAKVAQNGPVEIRVYKDGIASGSIDGSFMKKDNEKFTIEALLEFLSKHLKKLPEGAPVPASPEHKARIRAGANTVRIPSVAESANPVSGEGTVEVKSAEAEKVPGAKKEKKEEKKSKKEEKKEEKSKKKEKKDKKKKKAKKASKSDGNVGNDEL